MAKRRSKKSYRSPHRVSPTRIRARRRPLASRKVRPRNLDVYRYRPIRTTRRIIEKDIRYLEPVVSGSVVATERRILDRREKWSACIERCKNKGKDRRPGPWRGRTGAGFAMSFKHATCAMRCR